MNSDSNNPVTFSKAIVPILVFFLLLIFGLLIYPQFMGEDLPVYQKMLPVEILILIALLVNTFYLMRMGFSWDHILNSMVKKVGESIPVVLILLSVGVLIGSWIVSGTIPMLIYYGISMVDPNWIYVIAFVICILFSLLTGTSWGSAGTIGIVMIGIAEIYDANLAITAAAIVGGSFFGDKMSPLSDTTNVASLATDVPLMEHIKSMMYTTLPAAIIAAIIYISLSPYFSDAVPDTAVTLTEVNATLTDLESIFNFNILLLLPLVIVIWGSMKQKPIVIVLLSASFLACILALIFQDFSIVDVFASLKDGFNISMSPLAGQVQSGAVNILNRGGLYNLIEGVMVCLLIFAFIGSLDVIDAIQVSLKKVMSMLKKRGPTVLTSLLATFFTNIMISNQYATSFIIGASFSKKYDELKINRKVLSRSIEDAGTMMENLAPWTPSGIFMASTLGVPVFEYVPYQFISIIGFILAIAYAITGIACFYDKEEVQATS